MGDEGDEIGDWARLPMAREGAAIARGVVRQFLRGGDPVEGLGPSPEIPASHAGQYLSATFVLGQWVSELLTEKAARKGRDPISYVDDAERRLLGMDDADPA